MAKTKTTATKTAKTPKKRSTKYTKLAAVCSKELSAKKKALVLAEKRLSKAQRAHAELLAEVARLDMLDRSLRALNEGLEPPQNVRYVYTYPQWVWQPNPWQWGRWYVDSYTITCGSQNAPLNVQQQAYTNCYNSGALVNSQNSVLTTNCYNSGALVNSQNSVLTSTSGCPGLPVGGRHGARDLLLQLLLGGPRVQRGLQPRRADGGGPGEGGQQGGRRAGRGPEHGGGQRARVRRGLRARLREVLRRGDRLAVPLVCRGKLQNGPSGGLRCTPPPGTSLTSVANAAAA